MTGFEKGTDSAIALYVHVPFCAARCRYCDFASCIGCRSDMEAYTEALLDEMMARPLLRGAPVRTVFFGGGTPGLLPVDLMEKIISGLRGFFDMSRVEEQTLESNPEVTDRKRTAAWRSMGFDRLSLGLQSSEPRILSMLGRRATPEQYLSAVSAAKAAGFARLNADLMASLPGQTEEDLLNSVRFAAASCVSHISLYSLVLHESTPLGRDVSEGRLRLPDEDSDRDFFRSACDLLKKLGYERYEISNFCKEGEESLHNLVYWEGGPYLGLGPSAASYDGSVRWTNRPDTDGYVKDLKENSDPVSESETLEERDRAFERLMLGLRLLKGISLPGFRGEFGWSPDLAFPELLRKWEQAGLASVTAERLRLTENGLDVQNALLVELMEAMKL